MTDRMSNVEIEDVLSSIRRLVSDELRPMAPLRPAAAPRLMLTPALRVDSPPAVAAAPELAEPEVPAILLSAEMVAEDPPELALRLAELEVLLDAQDQPFEAEADEEFGRVAVTVWQLSATEAGQPVPEAPFVSDEEPVGLAKLPEGPQPDWQAVMGAAQAADVAAAEAPPSPSPTAVPQAEDVALDLDAEMLRELIRDVLREELQGNMGERVTRNLRKMVRSELARALAARGLA